jgi:hypothetical protein
MTDTPSYAANDLTPPPQPSIEPLPVVSPAHALSLKQELFAREDWRTRWFSGDVEAHRQYDQIVRSLAAPQPPPPDSRESLVDHIRQTADISEAVADQIRNDLPVSPIEYKLASQRRDQLFADQTWIERYNRGERRAVTELALVNIVLASRIRDNPQEI